MKRLWLVGAAGALLVGTALPALAQQAGPTVSFTGQMRVYGYAADNVTDFKDTGSASTIGGAAVSGAANKDSDAYFFQRTRVQLQAESADKKVRGVWRLEIGDITWGSGGGASGDEYGVGSGTRNFQSSGGNLGADGVNVETKNLYTDIDITKEVSLRIGIQGFSMLDLPSGSFTGDDAGGIRLTLRFAPVDIILFMAKVDEQARQDADDNTFYMGRFGVNITKDMRLTVEGLVVDQQCMARRVVAVGTGTCVGTDVGDTFWIGMTFSAKAGPANLAGGWVYGQRQLFNRAASGTNQELIEESGFGVEATATVPFGPVSTAFHVWYYTGDERRIAGGGCEDVRGHPACGGGSPATTGLPTGRDFSTYANSVNLTQDSDKLPLPITGGSYQGLPYIGEFLFGQQSVDGPGFSATHYADKTGTYGFGASAQYAITPAFSVGGGVAYVGATEDAGAGNVNGGGVYGDWAVEIDAGLIWRFNPNLTMNLMAATILPDRGDTAWGALWRTQFNF